ncbi:MAG: hypothetical protein ACYSU0_23190 [Planctomycetota bacterium]
MLCWRLLCGTSTNRSDHARILDPAYKNTAYSEEDLARALLGRQVMLQGTFVRAR